MGSAGTRLNRHAVTVHDRSPRCRSWMVVPAGWVHADGRVRLRCHLGKHPRDRGCESVDGWLWQPDRREVYPQRWWRCQGRYPDGSQCRVRFCGTENAARVRGWRIFWTGRCPCEICPRCAAPALAQGP